MEMDSLLSSAADSLSTPGGSVCFRQFHFTEQICPGKRKPSGGYLNGQKAAQKRGNPQGDTCMGKDLPRKEEIPRGIPEWQKETQKRGNYESVDDK